MGVYSVSVVGESFKNSDGSSRQAALRKCRPGDSVTLQREPNNRHDANAVAVVTPHGCIGMISRDNGWICERLDAQRYVVACVEYVAKDPEAGLYGAVIRVSTDAEIDLESTLSGGGFFARLFGR